MIRRQASNIQRPDLILLQHSLEIRADESRVDGLGHDEFACEGRAGGAEGGAGGGGV